MYSIGLDISKSTVDIFIPINQSNIKIKNSMQAIKSFYSKLQRLYKKDIDKLVFVFEPTGTYSNLLKKFCSERNIKCFIINPKKSINFAKAIGQRNKSDIQDSVMLSKMLVTALADEIKVPIINIVVEELHELISYYKFLLKQRTQYKNHLEAISTRNHSSVVTKNIIKEIKLLNIKIDNIIKEMKELIKSDKDLWEAFNNILTIKGVGDILAIVLLHHFIKYPYTNQKEIISLAGLDPISKSSGTSIQSKAKISKAGSKLCRSTLFMAVMVAVRFNDELKIYYERLKQRGKHTTVTQIAVMRKIIIIAHSLYKNNEKYDEKKCIKFVA
ncbi:transposase, IS110 family [Aliarcobacter faecis]|uniref:IS110 family transposase n=1 Tax=Aliarcobacter faecis TaxID=1564138 RepID=UPI00047E2D47|nr:IS110 family transposase [Aliarcobacter faecis]QKF73423.1 transposase, IS110 family [Aliarcobacter faecis]